MTLGSTNSDFEAGNLGGWDSTSNIDVGSTGVIAVTTGSARSGNYGCRMYGSGTAPSYWDIILKSTTFTSDFDNISFYYQMPQSTGNIDAQVWITAYSSTEETPISMGSLTYTTTWTLFSKDKADITLGDSTWGANTYFFIEMQSLA